MKTVLTCTSLLLLISAGLSANELAPGAPFDIAPFGFRTTDTDGAAHGVRWAEPRKVRRVIIEFDEGQLPSEAGLCGFSTGTGSGTARPIR
jgi:hypothetical protein